MKILAYILAGVIAIFSYTSCKTSRHTRSEKVRIDTFTVVRTDTFTNTKTETATIIIRDTVVTTPAAQLTQSFTPGQLATHTQNGKAVPHTYFKDTADLHIRVTVEANGNVTIHTWKDSGQIVLKNLVERTTERHDSSTQANKSTTVEKRRTAESYFDEIKKLRLPWWVWAILALVVLIELAAWVWRFYRKKALKIPV